MRVYRDFGYAQLANKAETADRNPLQKDELQTLINLADERGYTVESAQKIKSRYGAVVAVLSDLYAAWYAMENEITVFADNFTDLIKFTGWNRSDTRLSDLNIGRYAHAA